MNLWHAFTSGFLCPAYIQYLLKVSKKDEAGTESGQLIFDVVSNETRNQRLKHETEAEGNLKGAPDHRSILGSHKLHH